MTALAALTGCAGSQADQMLAAQGAVLPVAIPSILITDGKGHGARALGAITYDDLLDAVIKVAEDGGR
ncbi:hypothetical protein ACQP1K_00255 [Sphaerimonospora sp. CA-214678]|uniref:hypothetical protein n=1 Tax=Sphaerimonospora sp. CA-214678 TaxID=3240029 RepID=UPI003D912BFF